MTKKPKTYKVRIRCEYGDPSKPNFPAMVVPANLDGILSAPLAKQVLEFTGDDLKKAVRNVALSYRGKIDVGDSFITEAFRMRRRGVKKIIHAVITDHPGGFVTLNSVDRSIRSALRQSVENGIDQLAIPGLGIASGRLDGCSVASIIAPIAREYCNRVEIKIVDDNKEFIDAIKSLLSKD